MSKWIDIITGLLVSIPAILLGYFKTKKGRARTLSYIRRLFNLDITADDLRAGLDNISAVVDAQGNSISYLTTQLDSYREQLDSAREQLKEMENLHQENTKLKKRIVELENQVSRLEAELERRKKYTPKKYKEETK